MGIDIGKNSFAAGLHHLDLQVEGFIAVSLLELLVDSSRNCVSSRRC
jgi:hypothetical protein